MSDERQHVGKQRTTVDPYNVQLGTFLQIPSSPWENLSGTEARLPGRRFVFVGVGERCTTLRSRSRSLVLSLEDEAQSRGSEARMGQIKSRGWECSLRGRPSAVDDEAATAASKATTDFEGRVP